MGNGTVNKGINSITVKFEKARSFGYEEGSTFIIKKVEKVIGSHFKIDIDPHSSYVAFKQKIEDLRIQIPLEKGKKEIEIIFTLKKGYTWEWALNDPFNSFLVQSRYQLELAAQYAQEDAQAALAKQQRRTQYEARVKDEKADDQLKGIIRDGSGKIIINIYECQHRGSDYANKLNVSFALYVKSGFMEKYLRVVILDYYNLLNSEITDLQELNNFLTTESATYLGKFVTWTGAIDRPSNFANVLNLYDSLLQTALFEYKSGGSPDKALDKMGKIYGFCSYASTVLNKFYEESVSHSQRIALALQIAQMAIPIGASAKGLQMLCIVASEKFSYEITKKVVYGTDVSWGKTILNTGLGTVYDVVLRFGVSSLVSKIPIINGIGGIKGDIIKIAVNTVTTEVANSIGEAFRGSTFGEALSNLYKKLTNYEGWVTALVTHASNKCFGKYLDVPTKQVAPLSTIKSPNTKADIKKPDLKSAKNVSVDKPTGSGLKLSSTLLLPIVLLFGFSRSAIAAVEIPSKPSISEAQKGDTSTKGNTSMADQKGLDRGIIDKGMPLNAKKPSTTSQEITQHSRSTDNPTEGPEKSKKEAPQKNVATPSDATKPPVVPDHDPSGIPPVASPMLGALKPRRKKLKTIEDEDSDIELTAAYKKVKFKKEAHPPRYKYKPHGFYQTSKTGKDYEYVVRIKKSDGNMATIKPDNLVASADKERLDIEEYKNFKNTEADEEIMGLVKKNKDKLNKNIYKKLEEFNAHYKFLGDKIFQMMNYVELVAKYPNSFDKIVYHCSDKTTALIYDSFVKANLIGIYHDSPSLRSFVDKIEVIVDRP